MARVNKQLLTLLESMSPADVKALHEKLAGPKLKALTQEKANLEKKLQAVEAELAQLGGAAPPVKRRRRRRKKAVKAAKAPKAKRAKRAKKARKAGKAAPARKRTRTGSTMADTIESIMAKAGAPMRFKEICDALVATGHPQTQSMTNYVNRVLSVSPQFAKAGRGVYVLKGSAGASAAKAPKKRGRPKKAAAAA